MIVREDRRERDDAIAKRRGGKKVKKQEEEKEALKPGYNASKDDDNVHDNLDCDDKDHFEDDFCGSLMSVVYLLEEVIINFFLIISQNKPVIFLHKKYILKISAQ